MSEEWERVEAAKKKLPTVAVLMLFHDEVKRVARNAEENC